MQATMIELPPRYSWCSAKPMNDAAPDHEDEHERRHRDRVGGEQELVRLLERAASELVEQGLEGLAAQVRLVDERREQVVAVALEQRIRRE